MLRITIFIAIFMASTALAFAEIEVPNVWKGSVLDSDGKPVADATVCLGTFAKLLAESQTDQQGNFCLLLPQNVKVNYLHAFKKGVGFDFVDLQEVKKPEELYTLKFNGINPFRVRFVDQDGKPVASYGLDVWIVQNHDKEYNSSAAGEMRLGGISDEQGYVRFPCLPRGYHITFMMDGLYVPGDGEAAPDKTVSDKMNRFHRDPYWFPGRDINYNPNESPNEIIVVLAPTVPVSGKVLFDGGKPVLIDELIPVTENFAFPGGVNLMLFGRGFLPCDIPCNPGRTRADFERIGCFVDKNGNYSMTLFGDMLYTFGPGSKQIDGKWYGAAPKRDLVSKVGSKLENVDFVYKPFTKVSGQLQKNGQPFANRKITFYRFGIRSNELPPDKQLKNTDNLEGYIQHAFHDIFVPDGIFDVVTDGEGRLEISLPPGIHSAIDITNRDEYMDNIRGNRDLRTPKTAVQTLFEVMLDGETECDLGNVEVIATL